MSLLLFCHSFPCLVLLRCLSWPLWGYQLFGWIVIYMWLRFWSAIQEKNELFLCLYVELYHIRVLWWKKCFVIGHFINKNDKSSITFRTLGSVYIPLFLGIKLITLYWGLPGLIIIWRHGRVFDPINELKKSTIITFGFCNRWIIAQSVLMI